MWTDEYIGLPFLHNGRDRNGLDCWGLIQLVYQEKLGIELPTYGGIYKDSSPQTMREIGIAMDRERERWRAVSQPKDYDVVLLKIAGKLPTHVGVVSGKFFLHIMSGTESIIERMDNLMWAHRISGVYRCK